MAQSTAADDNGERSPYVMSYWRVLAFTPSGTSVAISKEKQQLLCPFGIKSKVIQFKKRKATSCALGNTTHLETPVAADANISD